MKVIELASFGDADVLRLAERAAPVAGAGEVLIRVVASGINRPDVLQRAGHYPAPAGSSDLLGLEVAGTILSGDPDAMNQAGLAIGDRVCALVTGGGYAEQCVAPVGQCLRVPRGWSDIEAATLPETVFTVWSNVFDRAHLQAGEWLLIQGGTSGIGVTAIQMAKAFGATVVATAGSDAKCEACLSLGADFAINYKREDFQTRVLELTNGRGVDVILDMVAGSYVSREVQCLSEDGRLVIIAVQGGVQSELNAGLVLRKRLTVTGSTLRPRSVEFKAAIAKKCEMYLWPFLDSGTIKAVIHRAFPAVDLSAPSSNGAVQAHRALEAGLHIGKLVLTWET